MKLLFFFLNLFAAVICCVLLAYIWGPSVIRYSSPVLQAMGDLIKLFSSIIGAVLAGFFVLKAMRL